MGFAKFNICSPCCNYEFTCHPYTVVDIVDPRDNISDTPTESDLYANLLVLNTHYNSNCQVLISMYPSGGNLETPGLYPSSIIPCKIPKGFFSHTTGNFIESYENRSVIDLNTLLKKVTANSKQRFDVPRDTGASAIQCGPLFGIGPIQTGCPCYEVSGNHSSAWGMINYQVYPHQFYEGCDSGQYNYQNSKYSDCSQIYNVCSADICNGSGLDKHQSVKLPYCLTEITAEFPYYLDGASINGNEGIPSNPILYDSIYGICNTSTPYYIQKTSILSIACYSSTGNIYKWYYKPNLYGSGCSDSYLNASYTTAAMVKWSPILSSGDPSPGLCNNQTRYIIFDCQSLSINTCGTTNFTPAIISDKTGYQVPFYQCHVADSCPACLPLGYYTFAKKPLSTQVTYSLPNAAGYEYSGDLYLDNVYWEGSAGVGAGCGVWVPNPFTQACAGSYDVSFTAFVAATAVSISYNGYQPSTYCFRGLGCNNMSTCYQNEWNYALAYAISVDMGFGCTPLLHPVVKLTNPSRYYPTDADNTKSECCDKTTGNPNGTLVSSPGDCDPLPAFDYAYRAASPGNLWNNKSCCELYVAWVAFPLGMTWAQYCNAAGKPECVNDQMPATKSPESYSLINDICNDVMDCSVYDSDGNLIYTVTI